MNQYTCGKDFEKCGILNNDNCCNTCEEFEKCLKDNMVCRLYDIVKRECKEGLMIKKKNPLSICKPIRSHEQIDKERWLIKTGKRADFDMDIFKDKNTLKTLLGIEARIKGYENTEDYLNSLISNRTKKIYEFIKGV